MAARYELIVIGTGAAATAAATRVREAGWRVAVVDHRPFGGTCALRGCDPKKMLFAGAALTDHASRMQGKGVKGALKIDWPDLLAFKRAITDPVPVERERLYGEAGIEVYHGRARFTGPSSLEVEGQTLQAQHILIAAGAEPVELRIPGEEYLITSEDFLELESLPGRIAFVGGGYIAAEFSNIAAQAGAHPIVLQRGARMLERFDPDLVDWLTEKFEGMGIRVETRTSVESVEQTGGGYRVRALRDGRELTVEADIVVHAAGRVPAIAALDLPAAGIAVQDERIELDEYLRSVSNEAVYVAGDAAQAGPPLTPIAGRDGRSVAANLLEGPRYKPDYTVVPSVVFTLPPLAAVGLGESEAREAALKFRVNCQKGDDWFTARQAAEPTYGFKVLVEEATDRILGAHLLGPHAEEVINLFAVAIRHGLTASQLRDTVFAYPTGASDLSYML
jgi:glutathione reductase (NADPH)